METEPRGYRATPRPYRGGGGWNQTCSASGRGLQAIVGDGQDRKTLSAIKHCASPRPYIPASEISRVDDVTNRSVRQVYRPDSYSRRAVSDEEMKGVNVTYDKFHRDWNYGIRPRAEGIR